MKTLTRAGVSLGLMLLLVGCGGKDGKDGTPGAAGTNGTNGTNGTAGITFKSGMWCSKADAGSGTSLILQYRTTVYSTGDRLVEAEIIVDKTYSSSAYYPTALNGSVTGAVLINYNLPGDPSGPYWIIRLSGATASFKYSNSGGAHDQYTYTFVSGDCNNY